MHARTENVLKGNFSILSARHDWWFPSDICFLPFCFWANFFWFPRILRSGSNVMFLTYTHVPFSWLYFYFLFFDNGMHLPIYIFFDVPFQSRRLAKSTYCWFNYKKSEIYVKNILILIIIINIWMHNIFRDLWININIIKIEDFFFAGFFTRLQMRYVLLCCIYMLSRDQHCKSNFD